MSIKAKEFDLLLVKLGLRTRDSADVLAWFEFEGKIIYSYVIVEGLKWPLRDGSSRQNA